MGADEKQVASAPDRHLQPRQWLVVAGAVALLGGLAVYYLVVQARRPAALDRLALCPEGMPVGAGARCRMTVAAEVTARLTGHRREAVAGGVRDKTTYQVDLRLLRDGRLLEAHLTRFELWRALKPGDKVEAVLLGTRVIQLRHGAEASDTLDNPYAGDDKRTFVLLVGVALVVLLFVERGRRAGAPEKPPTDSAGSRSPDAPGS